MVERWVRIGLIVNPCSGGGNADQLRIARQLVEALAPKAVLTGRGGLGSGALGGWPGRVEVLDAGEEPSRRQSRLLAAMLIDGGVDALAVVGGDGTLADTAQVCIEKQSMVPIAGVGAGSTNVGRLITCLAKDADELDRRELELWRPDCLLVYLNGELAGVAFNDAVIGNTVVGTLEGKRRDLDAAELLRGRRVACRPGSIGGARTRVVRVRGGRETVIAEGEGAACVVAGFAEARFLGKAIAGGICLAAAGGAPAGCLVSDRPLVQIELDAVELPEAEVITSRYAALGDDGRVVVEGVRIGAVLCADGNPLREITESDRVEIGVRRSAVTGVRRGGKAEAGK